jgi:hypothetical protein
MNTYPSKKPVPEYGTVKPSALFKQAIAEDSNRIGDWMWYAGQLKSDNERLYCFKRVIYIDPTNRLARKAVQEIKKAKRIQSSDPRLISLFVHLFRGA